jgi:hypothetical protein
MMFSTVASAAHPHRAAAKLGSRAPTRALRNAAVAPRRKVARQLIEATISKDNVFANNPGSLAALSAMGVNNQVPVQQNMMPFEDMSSATMPHRERLKVFSGTAHPELANVSPTSFRVPIHPYAIRRRVSASHAAGSFASARFHAPGIVTPRRRVPALDLVTSRRERGATAARAPLARISKIRFPNRAFFQLFFGRRDDRPILRHSP